MLSNIVPKSASFRWQGIVFAGFQFRVVRLDPVFQFGDQIAPHIVVLVMEDLHAQVHRIEMLIPVQLHPAVREGRLVLAVIGRRVAHAQALVARVCTFRQVRIQRLQSGVTLVALLQHRDDVDRFVLPRTEGEVVGQFEPECPRCGQSGS